jgi:hypothetical protein
MKSVFYERQHFPRFGVGNTYPFARRPWARLTGGLCLYPRSTREAGAVDGLRNPIYLC